jgi:endonuclease-3
MENRKENHFRNSIDRKKLYKYVLKELKKKYKNIKTELKYSSPLELLIAIILSAQCTDRQVNIVTEKLFKIATNLDDYLLLEIKDIEKIIYSTGFYKNKAKNIYLAVRQIKKLGNIPQNIEELIKIAGVGRKTANVFLAELYNISEGIIIDTHIFRVTKRLGISLKNNPITMEKDLMDILDKKDRISYSNMLIRYGRDTCKARKPLCKNCKFNKECHFFISQQNI